MIRVQAILQADSYKSYDGSIGNKGLNSKAGTNAAYSYNQPNSSKDANSKNSIKIWHSVLILSFFHVMEMEAGSYWDKLFVPSTIQVLL